MKFDYKKYLTHRVSKNAMANLVRSFLQIVIAFVGNYIVVRMVPKEEIGLWSLVFVFSNFLNLADLGVSQALIRYVANDKKNLSKYFWTTMQFYLIFGLAAIVMLFGMGMSFKGIFFKGANPDYLLVILMLLGIYCSLLGTAFSNVFNGLQMMEKSSFVEVAKSLIHYMIVILLYPKLGKLVYSLGFIGSGLLACILGYLMLRKVDKISFVKFDKKIFKKLFDFGIKVFGVQMINQIKGWWLPFIISSFFGINYVAYTDYATRIMGYFRQMLLSVLLPIMPATAEYCARNENKKINRLYKVSLLALLGIGFMACVGFVILIPKFIIFWLGEGYRPVIVISQIICWAVFFNLLTGPGVYILQGINMQKPVLKMSFVAMILFLMFTYLAANSFGFNEVFVGNVLAEGIVSLGFLLWFGKKKRELYS